MCFSNLPIEFDDEGNPYLAAEAEAVDRPADSDSPDADDVELDDVAPETMYAAILETMPSAVRERVAESGGTPEESAENDQPRSVNSD